ncbi:hypothetical protein GE09DRAFT_1163999 [Coniochaeta sp. 2T2.1]|nr:hypothetical protein GE09DRAFT_1163999 [Coniochaeta sp. 2T2.1]
MEQSTIFTTYSFEDEVDPLLFPRTLGFTIEISSDAEADSLRYRCRIGNVIYQYIEVNAAHNQQRMVRGDASMTTRPFGEHLCCQVLAGYFWNCGLTTPDRGDTIYDTARLPLAKLLNELSKIHFADPNLSTMSALRRDGKLREMLADIVHRRHLVIDALTETRDRNQVVFTEWEEE